jgi:uncharacterized LabA/DUF88 family protein
MYKKENNFAFIDSQNLNLGIQELGWKLDYRKFRIYLREKYSVQRAYLFIGYLPENNDMYIDLQQKGYVLVFKQVLRNDEGIIKGNVDADLVLQTMRDYKNDNFDNAVIVTSDGDFYCLVDYLYQRDVLKRVLSPNNKKCSDLLKKKGRDKMAFLDVLRHKLEYKKSTP